MSNTRPDPIILDPIILKRDYKKFVKSHIQYYLLEENRYKNKKIPSLTGYLFQFENCFDYNVMNGVIKDLDQFLSAPEQASLRRAFAIWISQVLAPSKGLSLADINTEDLSEVKNMLAERVKQWEKELKAKGFEKGVERGIEQGIERGIKQGIEKGETKILQRQLKKRFGILPDWVLEKLSQASTTELEHWSLQLLDVTTLAAVFTDPQD